MSVLKNLKENLARKYNMKNAKEIKTIISYQIKKDLVIKILKIN